MDNQPIRTLPEPTSNADAAYLDFCEGVRFFIIDGNDSLGAAADAAVADEAARTGQTHDKLEQIAPILDAMPGVQLRNRVSRSQQEMMYRKMDATFSLQNGRLQSELNAAAKTHPERLILDPDLDPPAYAQVEFHIQPGGYHMNDYAGASYHYGTKVFFRGSNDLDQRQLEYVEAVPLPDDGQVAHVVDLACSIGQSTTWLKQRFPDAHVEGIDYAAPMLRYAHARAIKLNSEVVFRQALIEDTGLASDSQDIAYAYIVFHELPLRIIADTIREAFRILRPGGVFAIFDFKSTSDMSPWQIYGRDFDARHNGEPYSQDFCDHDMLASLTDAGFEVTPDDELGRFTRTWIARKPG